MHELFVQGFLKTAKVKVAPKLKPKAKKEGDEPSSPTSSAPSQSKQSGEPVR